MKRTPIIKLEGIIPNNNIYAKLEGHNPTGSIKDRFAEYVIDKAEQQGELKKGMTIVELSAGNTAVSLANKAKEKGYRCHFLLPESSYQEIYDRLKQMGRDIILETVSTTDPFRPIEVINEMGLNKNYFWTKQYYRIDSESIYRGLAEEISLQTKDKHPKFNVIAASCGTGGTITGLSRIYCSKSLAAVAAPEVSIPGLRQSGFSSSYNNYQDILPKSITQVPVNLEEAKKGQKMLLEQGILAGESGGAAIYSLYSHLKSNTEGGNSLIILADGKILKQ